MCEPCDTVILQNPLDPFGLTEEDSAEKMPLQVGTDVYDFTNKVKGFYYDRNKWIDYSTNGITHVRKWFGKEKAALQLDECLRELETGS